MKYKADKVFEDLKRISKKSIPVRTLYEKNRVRLSLRSVNGLEKSKREITDKNLHRPGLALAGYVDLFTYHRVQVMGNTEIHYLQSLPPKQREAAFRRLFDFPLPCIIITAGNVLEENLVAIATEHGVPIFSTKHETTKAVYFLGDFLDDQFAPKTVIHGAFVDVYGIGVLFVGRSGIGKSEIALDLVERGHRLVADDIVMVIRKGEGILMGSGSSLVKHFMEVRGLGLIDIQSIFGIRAIRFQKRIEVVVVLEEWDEGAEYTRTGLDSDEVTILDVPIPLVRLPIFPGKNVTVISEVIALNYLLKHYGYDSAKAFAERLKSIIEKKAEAEEKSDPMIDWFEHDFE
ncbi:MAG: HPr(Ser) kinase/phosphatase [Bacteroidota bacterium]|nr:HPr(Ser) kinase/phosphatase [Bacteroidota bacterium]